MDRNDLSTTIQDVHRRITTNLTDDEWEAIRLTKNILRPFKLAQEFLEGQKYVTISCLPLIISAIRQALMNNDHGDDAILPSNIPLRDVLLDDLNARFGSEEDGTVAYEHLQRGPNNRPKGFAVHILLAVALDSRTKNGFGVGAIDIEDIYRILKNWAIRAVENNEVLALLNNNQAPGNNIRHRRNDNYYDLLHMMDADNSNDDDLLDEVGNLRYDGNPNNLTTQQRVENVILQYRSERKLNRIVQGVLGPDGKPVLANPLQWWFTKATKYPVLAHLARKILCIPATSAPVERFFSVAGLTIANDRAIA